MAELSEFLPRIMPHAMNALEPTVFQYLREAAKDFCRRTRSWREVVTIDIYDDGEPVAPVPVGANLFELEKAFLDRRPLEMIPYSHVDWVREPGLANYVSTVGGNKLVVSPPETGKLRLSMFLEPAMDCDELPDYLLHDHAEAIANGTLAKLLLLPNQPYTDPAKAGAHLSLFTQETDRLFSANVRGKQRAPLRSKPRYF